LAHGLGAALLIAACGGSETPSQSARAPEASAPVSHSATKHARTPAGLPELDPAQVLLGIRGHESELHECFDAAGEQAPVFVQLAWRVNEEGAAEDIHVARATTSNEAVSACLAERLSASRFGRPGHKSQASWTFVGGLVRFEDAETHRRNERAARRKKRTLDDNEQGVVIERSSPGKLDPDTVEGIVQSGYKLFAHCYRDGLDRHPALGGAVRLRFVIGSDGQVARVIDGGSDLPDEGVVACVAEGFFALRFPRPSGGNVHLRYRVHFESG
jgi:hypothetical protein